MGEATIISPTLLSVNATFRDPDIHRRPVLRYACVAEYRAWVHIVPLGVRLFELTQLRDARNILCRALMDLGAEIYSAQNEAKAAVRKSHASAIVNGVEHVGRGVDGKRFRAVAVDIGDIRVVTVVPVTQRKITIEISDLVPPL